MDKFSNYREWRDAIINLGGFTLDRSYCEERISALKEGSDKTTQSFLESYGEEYRNQVIGWFEQALKEA